MGQKVMGTFNGTGATVHIGLGFIPDVVKLFSVEDSEVAHAWWARDFRAAESDNGFVEHTDQAVAAYTAGTGFEPDEGGVLMTSSNQAVTTYGEGTYLYWDRKNYARDVVNGSLTNPINTWTLTTSGSRTGKFNADTLASGVTRIGEGSLIQIAETTKIDRWAVIEALTAGQGIADNEVTLSRDLASGQVKFISGMYSMIPTPLGEVSKAGFTLYATTDINVNDEIQCFIAESVDN